MSEICLIPEVLLGPTTVVAAAPVKGNCGVTIRKATSLQLISTLRTTQTYAKSTRVSHLR